MSYADDVINGDFCQVCGEYTGEGDGYAVTCAGCGGDDEEIDEEQCLEHSQNKN